MEIMKNRKYIAIFAVALLTGCDPLTDEYAMDDNALSADRLQITAVPVQADGKNGNVIIVENRSPILSEWTLGNTVTTRAYDQITVPTLGSHIVNFRGLNAEAGAYTEKTLTVQVDTISCVPDKIAQRLCIGTDGAPTYYGTTLDLSKIQIIVDEDAAGHKGNHIVVKNGNPIMTDWDFGGSTSNKNVDELAVYSMGEIPLKATFTFADGKQVTHDFGAIKVETFTYNPPQLITDLLGEDGEKNWIWADSNIFGFGGYAASLYPDWFAYDAATLGMYCAAMGRAGEETGTMTLTLSGQITLSSGRSGTFTYDLKNFVEGWSVGKLYVPDCSVLFGYAMNMENYQPGYECHEYDIVKCDGENLVLAAPNTIGMTDPWAPATLWCFKSVK